MGETELMKVVNFDILLILFLKNLNIKSVKNMISKFKSILSALTSEKKTSLHLTGREEF